MKEKMWNKSLAAKISNFPICRLLSFLLCYTRLTLEHPEAYWAAENLVLFNELDIFVVRPTDFEYDYSSSFQIHNNGSGRFLWHVVFFDASFLRQDIFMITSFSSTNPVQLCCNPLKYQLKMYIPGNFHEFHSYFILFNLSKKKTASFNIYWISVWNEDYFTSLWNTRILAS